MNTMTVNKGVPCNQVTGPYITHKTTLVPPVMRLVLDDPKQ